ncbi:MAG: GldG family protein, partial [Saprospiraceae bacterium]|nr:GldG family protein [Saprospiraceae bacterium]
MKNLTRILLLAGILLLINLLSRQFFFRIDATKDKQYTLSSATKNILKDMEEPVSITAYFTKDLPAQYAKNYTDLRDLLIEYNTRSGGMLDYEFIDPEGNDEIKQEAMQNGIAPLLINVREKDKVVQKNAFMGAIVSSGDNKDVINYFPPGGAVEYQLTTSIKKVVSIEKPTVAISQGFGSPPFQELQLLQQSMQILYNVTSIDLSSGEDIDPSIRC